MLTKFAADLPRIVTVFMLALVAATVSAEDRTQLAQIAPRMREFVEARQIAGAVTLAAQDGRVVHLEAVGQADIESHQAMRADSMFAVASMTKPIAATAVLILQDEGRLSVDDPVSKYLPRFKDVSLEDGPPSQEVTIRHMLTHTSGLTGSQQCTQSLQATVDELAQRTLAFEPGSAWQYSPGLNVCGRIVEVVSGRSFEEFLRERIFQPLKMKDTTFHPSPAQQARIAVLYEPGEGAKTLQRATHWINDLSEPRVPNPSAGLFSTAADMARFYQMLLDGGELDGTRILSREAVRQMTTAQTGDLTTGFTPGNAWGLGWCVVREPQGVTSMLSSGTFGHGGAFGTQGWVDPQHRRILVLMIQRTGFGNSDASEIRGEFQTLAVEALRD